MKMKMTCKFILIPFAVALAAASARAEEPSAEELKRAVAQLQAEVARLKAEAAGPERLSELERRIGLLAQELEKTRTGGAVDVGPRSGGLLGFAPAASKVYRAGILY